ncbi:MAG: hypothetical protein ABIU96_14745 [Rhodanobacter sp.]
MHSKCLPQISEDTVRGYWFVAIYWDTRWGFMRVHGDQNEADSAGFLRSLQATAPMKIEKLLTGNDARFPDRLTRHAQQPSKEHVSSASAHCSTSSTA